MAGDVPIPLIARMANSCCHDLANIAATELQKIKTAAMLMPPFLPYQ